MKNIKGCLLLFLILSFCIFLFLFGDSAVSKHKYEIIDLEKGPNGKNWVFYFKNNSDTTLEGNLILYFYEDSDTLNENGETIDIYIKPIEAREVKKYEFEDPRIFENPICSDYDFFLK